MAKYIYDIDLRDARGLILNTYGGYREYKYAPYGIISQQGASSD